MDKNKNMQQQKKKKKIRLGEQTDLVVPSKRGGGLEVASNGGGRCSFTLLYNPEKLSKQSYRF
jgi:hypothetical protein